MKKIVPIFDNIIKGGVSGTFEEEHIYKILLINSFSYMGIAINSYFMIKDLLIGKWILSLVFFFFISIAIFFVLHIRITKKHHLAGHGIVLVMYLLTLCLYLFLGSENTGFYWFYTFTFLVFFVVGPKIGWILIISHILFIFVTYNLKFEIVSKYSSIEINRFLISYIITSLIAFGIERITTSSFAELKNTKKKIIAKNQEIIKKNDELNLTYRKLEEQEKKTAAIINNTFEAIGVADENGRMIYVNPTFEKMFGFSSKEILSFRYLNFIHKDYKKDFIDYMSSCIENKSINISFESKFIRKDNSCFWGKFSASIIHNNDNSINSIVGIVTDINELKESKLKIENAHWQIKSSLIYARKIQNALFPSKENLDFVLDNYFLLFRPKDIVSGDFYFIKKIDKYKIIAIGDCTGHGVPGSFMSVLGITLLNDQLRDKDKLQNPELILETLREDVINSLKQTYDLDSPKDGMDIGICVCDLENDIIKFAAAQHFLFLIRDNQLVEFRGDKMPIGIHILKEKKFSSQNINTKKDDIFYMLTDGYADQFDKNFKEKYKFATLKNLFLKIADKNLEEQKKILEYELDKWKGETEQIDDILIFGWKI